jgi:hypothetical protein
MSKPLIVSIPHSLGKAEAGRRLKSGLSVGQTHFGNFLTMHEETWEGDRLSFRASALGQPVGGTIDVLEDHVVVELQLPWLLARAASAAQALIRREGALLLEKK